MRNMTLAIGSGKLNCLSNTTLIIILLISYYIYVFLSDYDVSIDMMTYIRFCDFYQETHGKPTMNKLLELDLLYTGDHINAHSIIRKKYINVI